MQIEKRTMNWLPRQSLWVEAQERRAKRKEVASQMVNQTQNLNTAFSAARDNLSSGLAEITAKVAAARIEATAKSGGKVA